MTACPICTETMSVSPLLFDSSKRLLSQPCCGQVICQSCLYRHLQSVFQEGIAGNGRSQLTCPLGCGTSISDTVIRSCIQRAHPQFWIAKLWGLFLLSLLGLVISQDPLQTSRFYTIWFRWTHSSLERQMLLRYERWNLAVVLRGCGEEVMHCPAPDCGCAWIVGNARHRRLKQTHERTSGRSKFGSLWYRPVKPDTSGDYTWVLPEYVNLTRDPPEEELFDGRRAVCPKCHVLFCGLCRRPWNITRNKSHAGVTCRSYRTKSGAADSDYAFVAQLINARTCPGCSLRTTRIDGCNHMTCPCGKEWCYVCEKTWNRSHYTCVVQPTNSYSCAIS